MIITTIFNVHVKKCQQSNIKTQSIYEDKSIKSFISKFSN
jgi:hypothetical protein